MRPFRSTPSLLVLLATGCALDASTVPPHSAIDPPRTAQDASAPTTATRVSASFPDDEAFARTAASLPRPWTLAAARTGAGAEVLALARRREGAWEIAAIFDAPEGATGDELGCPSLPCPWPTALTPARPLVEPDPLPEDVRDRIAYARTLLSFEGPLDVHEEDDGGDRFRRPREEPSWVEELPASAWTDPASADLAPYLERLRRYHPMGYCSMDTRPQVAAQMRAVAAAQAGHTGWAVQGWMDTVGYWSSARMVWSSYGQSQPEGHTRLLEMVGVDPQRFLLGVIFDLPDDGRQLHLADVRRIVPDMGERFADELRALAGDARVDPLNRAVLFAAIADLPFAGDAQFDALPPESQRLLRIWSR